jgi:hypothetical protein
VDELVTKLDQLTRIDERQVNQSEKFAKLEKDMVALCQRAEDTEKKLEQWINRGIGAWLLVILLWALFKTVVEAHVR